MVLLVLQMSNLFSYKLGFAALLATSLVCLTTMIFIIFEQTTQISGLQDTLHTLCTDAVLSHIQNTNSIFHLSNLLSEHRKKLLIEF